MRINSQTKTLPLISMAQRGPKSDCYENSCLVQGFAKPKAVRALRFILKESKLDVILEGMGKNSTLLI